METYLGMHKATLELDAHARGVNSLSGLFNTILEARLKGTAPINGVCWVNTLSDDVATANTTF